MPRPGLVIPKAALVKILQKNKIRVSDKAVEYLSEFLFKFGIKGSKKANEIAKNANRKTITEKDIKIAFD